MAEEAGWFHCGRCGHLFQGVVGQSCPECGGHPVVEEKEVAFLEAANQFRSGTAMTEVAKKPDKAKGKNRRRKKKRGGLVVFVVGWLVFLGLLAGIANFLRRRNAEGEWKAGQVTEVAEDHRILNEAYGDCTRKVTEFLSRTTPEQRVQTVHDPTETLRRMVRFGGISLRVDEEVDWEWQRFTPLEIEGERAFEGVAQFGDGRRAEFVFLPDGDESWGIDWPNLVRYSEHPWPLFLSGSTPPTGEFRLLARRRAGSSGEVGDVTRIVLFAPDPWRPREIGGRSPEVEVLPGSRTARMLEEAFEQREDGRGALGSQLQNEDPVSMVRVRVKLRRTDAENGDQPAIEIEELIACHWLSVDDPGVDTGED